MYFVRLQIDAEHPFVNDYWLSHVEDDPALKPKHYADLTGLAHLAPANLNVIMRPVNSTCAQATITNTAADTVAFFVRVRLVFESNQTNVLPVRMVYLEMESNMKGEKAEKDEKNRDRRRKMEKEEKTGRGSKAKKEEEERERGRKNGERRRRRRRRKKEEEEERERE